MARLMKLHSNLVFALYNLEKTFDKQKVHCWSLLHINIWNLILLLSANRNTYKPMVHFNWMYIGKNKNVKMLLPLWIIKLIQVIYNIFLP